MIVVKVGGSLYDHPRLGLGLLAYLNSLPEPVLLVPGGGSFADAVRKLDAIHHLGDDASHSLAMKAMNLAGEFLKQLIPALVHDSRFDVYDAEFDNTLPHSWNVTSDSIAAQGAINFHASRLIILKSIDIPLGISWTAAAERGWVDPCFPALIHRVKFPIEVINFRRRLDSL
ncbi:MAG TPA: hypothetical protein VGL71_01920 [Urbifossiella sp.]